MYYKLFEYNLSDELSSEYDVGIWYLNVMFECDISM